MAAASTQRTGRDYRTNLWKDLQVFSPEGSHFSECDSSNSVSSLEFSSSCYQEICVNMSNRGSQRPNLFPAQMTDSHHPLVDAGTPGDARVVSPAHDGYFAPTGGVPSNCNPFGPRLRPPLQSSFRSPASNHGGPSPCPQSREVYSQEHQEQQPAPHSAQHGRPLHSTPIRPHARMVPSNRNVTPIYTSSVQELAGPERTASLQRERDRLSRVAEQARFARAEKERLNKKR
ncbi:hypothetical protein M758_UG318200, partial [Ceratodon purpureus]